MLVQDATYGAFSGVQRFGLLRTAHDLMLKIVNTVFPWKILRGITISHADAAFLKWPDAYTPMFLSQATIRRYASDPACEMSERFLDEAFSKGDECYAICHGETLAAYSWYSTRPTRIDPPTLLLSFGNDYVYMYKGFTHARYRGQRLHAVAMSLALESYRARGYAGLVSYVESNNFDSLKSCERMGYVTFGTAYVAKLFGRYFQHCSSGCEKFGFRVERAPILEIGTGTTTGPSGPGSARA